MEEDVGVFSGQHEVYIEMNNKGPWLYVTSDVMSDTVQCWAMCLNIAKIMPLRPALPRCIRVTR